MKNKQLVALMLLAMKVTAVQIALSVILVYSVYAATPSKAQTMLDKKVTLNADKKELKKIIADIQGQTGVRFIFSASAIGTERIISFNVKDQKLGVFLQQIFLPLHIGYRVVEDQLLLYNTDNNPADREGNISGTVKSNKGEFLPGVTIQLKNINVSALTDGAGHFELRKVPAGTYTLTISSVGYIGKEQSVTVTDGPVNIAIELTEDVLQLSGVVVTGGNPKKKIESSVAITTVSNKDIETRAPLNATDLLKAIPGLTVESTGGDGPGNVWVRGFPQQGGYIFLGIMEDGLPVIPTGFNSIPSADQYYKTDLTIKGVEAIRGGNAAILLSNTPGAVVNNLSYTGADQPYGKVKVTSGMSQSLYRVDFNTGGSISNHVKYNIGGFYRTDKGVVPPSYTANQGGQIKGNLTFDFKNKKGFIRVYGKYLNDKVQWMLPSYYAYDGSGKPKPINGYDLFSQSMATPDTKWSYTDAGGTLHNYDMADGIHTKLGYGGLQFNYTTDNGWTINNNFRYQSANTAYTVGIPIGATKWDGATSYYYTDGKAASLKSGDYIVSTYGIGQQNKDQQIIDYLDFKKKINKHQLTLGAGLYQYNVNNGPNYNFFFYQEMKEHGRRLLTSPTGDGMTALSVATLIGNTRTLSGYVTDEITLNDKWRLDVGFRLDNDHIDGKRPYYGVDASGNPDPTVSAGTTIAGYTAYKQSNTNWAGSLGLNYKISNALAMFARATKAYNSPNISDYNATQFDPTSIKKRPVYLGEVGVKYAEGPLSLFASASYSAIKNVSLTISVPTASSGLQSLLSFGSTRTYSAEYEISYRPVKNLGFRLTGTLQNSKYTDYKASTNTNSAVLAEMGDTTYSFTGKKTERVPALNTELSITYDLKRFNVNLSANYIGSRYTAPSDSYKLPAYVVMRGGAGYDLSKKVNIRAWVDNLLNTRTLTEGDVRGDQFRNFSTVTRGTAMAGRTILPRSFWASLSYEF
ncbi:TonB-dependent receptor [Chitinophaga sp.]|uniref:TonB-dependent receptor n=1 Tax=Chitinophaga sp. TaxID=1869181 RepID=UPI0031D45777